MIKFQDGKVGEHKYARITKCMNSKINYSVEYISEWGVKLVKVDPERLTLRVKKKPMTFTDLQGRSGVFKWHRYESKQSRALKRFLKRYDSNVKYLITMKSVFDFDKKESDNARPAFYNMYKDHLCTRAGFLFKQQNFTNNTTIRCRVISLYHSSDVIVKHHEYNPDMDEQQYLEELVACHSVIFLARLCSQLTFVKPFIDGISNEKESEAEKKKLKEEFERHQIAICHALKNLEGSLLKLGEYRKLDLRIFSSWKGTCDDPRPSARKRHTKVECDRKHPDSCKSWQGPTVQQILDKIGGRCPQKRRLSGCPEQGCKHGELVPEHWFRRFITHGRYQQTKRIPQRWMLMECKQCRVRIPTKLPNCNAIIVNPKNGGKWQCATCER